MEHGCDITRIWIGYVLSDARFDWLVGNMSMCIKKICFNQEFSFICFFHLSNYFEKYFIKAIEDFFPCFYGLIETLGEVGRILDSYVNPGLRLGFA